VRIAYFLLAIVLSCLILREALAADAPDNGPELGISLVRREGFMLDAKAGVAHLIGHGGAMVENGTVDPGVGGAPLDITFAHARDPDQSGCLSILKSALPQGDRVVIWGHGSSNSDERKDVFDKVVVTFDSITACNRLSVSPLDPVGAPVAADAPPGDSYGRLQPGMSFGGGSLSSGDYAYLKDALQHGRKELGVGEEQFLTSIFSGIAERVHDIISDRTLTDAQKKAALRELAMPGLSMRDYRYLAANGHAEMILHVIPGADQAQLRFLVRDKSIPDGERRGLIDQYLKVMELNLPGQKQEIVDEEERVASSVAVPAGLCAVLGFIVYLMQRGATASRETPPLRRLISWLCFAPGLALLVYMLTIYVAGTMHKDQYMLVLPIPVFLALGFFLRIPHHQRRHWVSLYSLGGAVAGIALACFGAATKGAQGASLAGSVILSGSAMAAFVSMVVPPYLEQGKGDIIFRALCFLTTLIFAALLFLAAALATVSNL
jgi:hypothetical protein